MIGLVDYHMHTVLSDGQNDHEEMVLAAIEKGLDEIGFTDHVCIKPVNWAMSAIDMPVMTNQIRQIQKKFKNKIKIRYGIELDYFPGVEAELKQIIDSVPLDFLIGSVHFINDWNFDSDKSLYGKWTNDYLYEMYFKLVQQAAASGLFDTIGHLDIIKKFRVYPESDLSDLFEETVSILAKNNIVVELNTGGADRPCGEFTPGRMLLEICHKHNVQVTLGSDAHHYSQIARHYETAIELLKETGYTEIVAFENRRRSKIRL
jgi:histidinol-phosphatase (PHP family)